MKTWVEGDGQTVGFCDPATQIIWLDADTASKWSKARQRDLVLHEIAHALASANVQEYGHDEVWAATAEKIGVRRLSIIRDLASASTDSWNKEDAAAAKLALTRITLLRCKR